MIDTGVDQNNQSSRVIKKYQVMIDIGVDQSNQSLRATMEVSESDQDMPGYDRYSHRYRQRAEAAEWICQPKGPEPMTIC